MARQGIHQTVAGLAGVQPIWGLINRFGVSSKAANSWLVGSIGSKQTSRALIECSPHVALLALLKFKKRLLYKVSVLASIGTR